MESTFRSPLKDELASFLGWVSLSVKDVSQYRSDLASFDAFLADRGTIDKSFSKTEVAEWLDTFFVKPATKQKKLTHIRRFARYLKPLGISTSLPELPAVRSEFVPYVCTVEEMAMIFEYADDLATIHPASRLAVEFPVYLRLLYGCGLRRGEAVALTWGDIDLDGGVITVRAAKNDSSSCLWVVR
jgi:integrase